MAEKSSATAIGIGSALIAAAVSLNGLVSSCTQQELDTNKRFRDAVTAEEQFWSGLYDDYLEVLSQESEASEDLVRKKVFALHAIGQHEVPTLGEFESLGPEVPAAHRRLRGMKAAFLDMLEDEGVTGRYAAELRQESFDAALTSAPARSVAGDGEGEEPAEWRMAREDLVLANTNPDGWDFDFFWCAEPGNPRAEAYNFAQARGLATAFANLAGQGRSLLPGTKIGRVRVRPVDEAPEQMRAQDMERWVAFDDGPGDREVAAEVRDRIASSTDLSFMLGRSTGTPTPYYTSVFSCAQAPPG